MTDQSFAVSFRVFHPNASPDLIAERLGMTPSVAWRSGDAKVAPNGAALGGVRKGSYCAFPVTERGAREGDLRPILERFNAVLRAKGASINEIVALEVRAEYFITLEMGEITGFSLTSEFLGETSKLGIDLAISVIAP